MDILFNNPLATMSGVVFLIFFAIVIIFTLIVLALIKSQIDKSDKMNLPPIPANIDPYEIAYLRGGTNEMARSVCFQPDAERLYRIQNHRKNFRHQSGKSPTERFRFAANRANCAQLDWRKTRGKGSF